MGAILDQLLNCYFTELTDQVVLVVINKLLKHREDRGVQRKCLEFWQLSIGSLSYCMPLQKLNIIKYVKNYILGNMSVTGLSIYFRQLITDDKMSKCSKITKITHKAITN